MTLVLSIVMTDIVLSSAIKCGTAEYSFTAPAYRPSHENVSTGLAFVTGVQMTYRNASILSTNESSPPFEWGLT
jgi:hypothetical protein